MAEVAIKLNGKVYRLGCGEDERARLNELSQIVCTKLDTLIAEHGQVGDDRLLLMSALMIADEAMEARARVEALEKLLKAVEKRTRPAD